MAVGERLAVAVGERVAVALGERVAVALGERVALAVAVAVAVGEKVALAVALGVAVRTILVAVFGTKVWLAVGFTLLGIPNVGGGVFVGVALAVALAVTLAVTLPVAVDVIATDRIFSSAPCRLVVLAKLTPKKKSRNNKKTYVDEPAEVRLRV